MTALKDMRVVVTRQAERAGKLSNLLRDHGAIVIELPTIAIQPPENWTEIDDSIRRMAAGEFSWVAFTSVNAVDSYLARLGCTPDEVFKKTKVAAVGSATKALLEERGVKVQLVPENYTALSLAEAMGDGGGRVLLPRAADVPPEMEAALRERGWDPHHVTAYRNVPASPDGEAARQVGTGAFDIVTFTSTSTVRGFAGMFDRTVLSGKTVATIGPVTSAACEELSIPVTVEAAEHTVEGLAAALTMGT